MMIQQIIGLREITILLSPLILAIILGGSNVYKVLFYIIIFYIVFVFLILVNFVEFVPYEVDITYKFNDENGEKISTSNKKICGILMKDRERRGIVIPDNMENVDMHANLIINFPEGEMSKEIKFNFDRKFIASDTVCFKSEDEKEDVSV